MKPRWTILILTIASLVGCKPSTEKVYNEVMDIHDAAMAKMDEIYQLKADLKQQLDHADDMVLEEKERLESLVVRLDSASKGMMDWMHDFHPELDSLTDEAYLQYLQDQLAAVKKVKADIEESIQTAKDAAKAAN